MYKRIRTWFLALALICGLMVSVGGSAAAQSGGLPAIKQPSSGRLDFTGSVTVNGQTVPLTGTGSFAGSDAQVDLIVTPPAGTSSGPVTVNTVVVGGKVYVKTSASAQWQVTDVNAATGMTGMSGLGALDPTQALKAIQAAANVRLIGKEQIAGAPTTKYQADVDLAKLMAGLGAGTSPASNFLKGAQMTLYLWVGDNDQYIHQEQVMITLNVPGSTPTSLSEEITITIHDFNAPITITAPADAVPLVQGGPAGTGMMPGMMPGMTPGTQTNAPPPGGGGYGGATPGMPRSGTPQLDGFLALGGLGMIFLALGLVVRRRAAVAL